MIAATRYSLRRGRTTFGEKTGGTDVKQKEVIAMPLPKTGRSLLERIADVLASLYRIVKVCLDLYVMVHGR
jgi:hypothetical protein